MNKTEIKVRAYRKARNYMAMHGKNTWWRLMSNSEKILFAYVRSVNEQILSKLN